jgi:hypothetical protein
MGGTHSLKVAGSNPAPATIDDEGLADAEAANPFRYPDFTQESVSRVAALVRIYHRRAQGRPAEATPPRFERKSVRGLRRKIAQRLILADRSRSKGSAWKSHLPASQRRHGCDPRLIQGDVRVDYFRGREIPRAFMR